MLALLQKLFIGHAHKWKVIKIAKIHDDHDRYVTDDYHLRCETCGKLRVRSL